MRTGIIFPAWGQEVVYASVSEWAEDYPIDNAADLIRTSKIARRTTNGVTTFSGEFPESRSVQALALIGHNLVPSAQVTLSFYAGPMTAPGAYVGGTGTLSPTGGQPHQSEYRRIMPIILPSPVTARSFYMTFNNLADPMELEAIEVGQLWEWPGISYGREIGVSVESEEISLVGGAAFHPETAAPRTISGQIDLLAMAKTSTTGLDFQKVMDLQRPFVWAEDFDDPATWTRRCLFARNVDLPAMVGALYRHDRFPIRMIEHMR